MKIFFSYETQRKVFLFFLILWALTSIAALVGMYHLWWTREYRLYYNKSVSEQRVIVFGLYGMSPALLNDTYEIDQRWPRYIHYETAGDRNKLSYIKYLLIPRVPSGSGNWVITEKSGKLLYTNVNYSNQEARISFTPKPRGFLISLLLLLGVTVLIKRFSFFQVLSLPERFVVAFLMLTLLTILSKVIFWEATFGFWFMSALGICGGVLAIVEIFNCEKYLNIIMLFRKMDISKGIIKSRPAFICIVLMLSFTVLWSMLMSVIVVPDDWDAWAIWGSKAKVLALGLGPLKDVTFFDHVDYPLLWPSLWAFSGWCAGGWEENWSRAWGPLLMLLCAWEVGINIHRLSHDISAGLFGAALFLSVPMTPLIASWSYAESALWLMMVCSFGYLLLWRKESHWKYLTIAGLFAAAAAYTKNEGLLFAFLGFLWVIAIKPKRFINNCFYYCIPLALFYIPWLWWIRVTLHLSSHAVAGINFDSATLLMAFHRCNEALPLIGRMWADIRYWNIVLWLILISAIYGVIAKKHLICLSIPLLMLLFSFVAIIFHQQEMPILITAWERITTQTLPLFLVVLVPLLFSRNLNSIEIVESAFDA